MRANVRKGSSVSKVITAVAAVVFAAGVAIGLTLG